MSRHGRKALGVLLVYVAVGWAVALAEPTPAMPRSLTLAFAPLAVAAIAGVILLARSSRP